MNLALVVLAGILAALPMYLTFDNPELEEGLKDTLPLLPFLIFPVWHILVGGIIAKGVELPQENFQ